MAFITLPASLESCTYLGVVTLDCVPVLFTNIVFLLFSFSGLVALIFVIMGGFKYMFSGGDAKKTEEARKIITYAVIGLILILMSFGIVNFIGNVTGVTCITKFGFNNCKR